MRIGLGVVLVAALAVPKSVAGQADEGAIRAARARSNAAIQAHNLDAIAAVWLPEFVSVSSTNARSVGRDSARAGFSQLFATRPGVVFVRTPEKVDVNVAWGQAGESGTWTGTWTVADGGVRVSGEYFAKWKRVSGEWKLVAETFVQLACEGGKYCDGPP